MTYQVERTKYEKCGLNKMLGIAVFSAVVAGISVLPAVGQSSAIFLPSTNTLVAAESPTAFAGIASDSRLAVPTVVEPNAGISSSSVAVALPEAPSALLAAPNGAFDPDTRDKRPVDSSPSAPYASKFTKYIPADERGMKITSWDKVGIGLKDVVSPFSFLGIIVSAGYSHVTNGEPNYGVDKGAFGERLWATAVRDSTEGFFTDSVMSPILHEDPRYYVEGPQFSFVHRVLYSATRPLITRTDSGHSSVNGALLLGYLGASALSYAYYPKQNQSFHDTASTYGGSIGGAALGDLVSEFADEVLQALHLEKKR